MAKKRTMRRGKALPASDERLARETTAEAVEAARTDADMLWRRHAPPGMASLLEAQEESDGNF